MQNLPNPPAAPQGLRERKKAQTRSDLERAAVELALANELDDVTIDDICARVPVSHRTFFNYFDSKEDALFGFRRAWGDREQVAAHLAETHRGDVVATVVDALFLGLPADKSDPDLHEARMLIASRNPGLIRRRMRRLDDLRTGLVSAVAELLEREAAAEVDAAVDAAASDGGVPFEAKAELLAVTCIGAVRIAVREWAEEGATGSTADVSARAVVLARSLSGYLAPVPVEAAAV
ncbi:TetR/AcrR family transcriptional regulator [Leifsonia sp. NPDC080035]|uniref:TetR/AcrR family transcriptional regulator n=1 Tax=Leifsonia sp. NPDC080035 TaxID=3143936 RepID=A0AAU7GGK3_9MICO